MNRHITSLYFQYFGSEPTSVETIVGSASNRLYLRMNASDGTSVIGVGCSDSSERRAFCELSACMLAQGLRVPHVLIEENDCYLQEDLGRVSLYDMIQMCQKNGVWDEVTLSALHQVMRDLPDLQFRALQGFDLSHCCGQQHFSEVNIRWDLNYFKYCFLKPVGVSIDELRLQAEFDRLERSLMSASTIAGTFLYRDFQSRNVMIRDGQPYYIDFQGGYEGPFYYDVASFLWQARAGYPEFVRESLLQTYLTTLRKYIIIGEEEFRLHLEQFVFFRLLQVLGAYGFRGIFEQKAAFLMPIHKALQMITSVGHAYPYIHQLIDSVYDTPMGQSLTSSDKELIVRITSFSYKKGIPVDCSGNGGGFVFDCRAPHNPGRYAEYKLLTGLDQPVIDFLEGRDSNSDHQPIGTELTMPQYMEHVYAIVDPAVETYLHRGFTSLMVSFGCTGGQHRSVYGAQHLAEHLHMLHPDLKIILTHREQKIRQEIRGRN